MTRVLSRVVPAVAAGCLVVATVVRVTHAPLTVFWIALAVGVVGVGVFAWLNGHAPVVSDAAAARLDADAGLAGELRSAHWFASHPAPNAWTTFHLDRATDHVDAVSWPAVYPPLTLARAWIGSIALALSAIFVVMTSAWPVARGARGSGRVPTAVVGGQAAGIPADLQKQIDDLIKAVQSGAMPMDVARAKVSELRDALAGLDPKTQAALAKAAADQMKSRDGSKSSKEADALAARAEKAAATPFLPQDMKWSMEDLAAKLKYSGRPTEKADGEESQKQSEKSPNAGQKNDAGAPKPGDAGVQMTRTTAADAQSSQMMASTVSPMGGERGQNADPKKGQVGQPLDLTGTLRKETVEADADSAGANVLAEMRKKSEQSHSTLGFSRVAPLAVYDKSHAAPPPPPADAIRPLLKHYFIRKAGS